MQEESSVANCNRDSGEQGAMSAIGKTRVKIIEIICLQLWLDAEDCLLEIE